MQGRLARLVTVFALLVVPAVAVAQQGPPAPAGPAGPTSAPMPTEAQLLLSQMEQIQMRIASVERRALADPALQTMQVEINTRIEATMTEINSAVPELLERLDSLLAVARSRTVSGDAAVDALVSEVQGIEAQLRAAQRSALERPEIAERIARFDEQFRAKMAELDPNVIPMLDEMQELEDQLTEMMGGRQ